MTHYDQFVLNSPHWSNTGLAVHPTVSLEGPGGFVVNCECTGDRPLVPPKSLPRFACPMYRQPVDNRDHLPLPTLNTGVFNCAECSHNSDCKHSFDTAGVQPVARGGVHSTDRHYNLDNDPNFRDFDDDEMEQEQQRRLGLVGNADGLPVPRVMAAVVADRRRSRRAVHA